MDNCSFLKSMFDGYCNRYRTLNQSIRGTWTDITQEELSYFYQLGSMLGYLPQREDEKRRDLSWRTLENSQLILHLERETESDRAHIAIENLFRESSKQAKYLVVSQLEDDGISAVLWFDKLTRNGLAQIPFTLSLSKSVFACLNPIKFRLTDH